MCVWESSIVPTHQPAVSVDLVLLWTQGALEGTGLTHCLLSPGPCRTGDINIFTSRKEKKKKKRQSPAALTSITSVTSDPSGSLSEHHWSLGASPQLTRIPLTEWQWLCLHAGGRAKCTAVTWSVLCNCQFLWDLKLLIEFVRKSQSLWSHQMQASCFFLFIYFFFIWLSWWLELKNMSLDNKLCDSVLFGKTKKKQFYAFIWS